MNISFFNNAKKSKPAKPKSSKIINMKKQNIPSTNLS